MNRQYRSMHRQSRVTRRMNVGVSPSSWFVRVLWLELDQSGALHLKNLREAMQLFFPIWNKAMASDDERISWACVKFIRGATKAKLEYLTKERQLSQANITAGNSKWLSAEQTATILDCTDEDREIARGIYEAFKD